MKPRSKLRSLWRTDLHFTIVHLSDIHVKSKEDEILTRGTLVGAATLSRLGDSTAIICIISGDLAFSGLKAQYDLLRTFLEAFRESCGVPVFFALAPGNHDLDFNRDTVARDLLIKTTIETSPTEIDPSILEISIAPQADFFQFKDSLMGSDVSQSGNALAYQYKFNIDHQDVEIRCLNSAWMSSINEKPGSLFLPLSIVNEKSADTFVISVLHHPFNWLTPTSKSTVRALEGVSDAILTGHEHEQERTSILRSNSGAGTTYFEAGALNGEDPALSEFSILQFDAEKHRYRFYAFVWSGERYESRDIVSEWTALPLSSTAIASRLTPTSDFALSLEDSGIPWLATDSNRRSRADIFIYPDLVESLKDPSMHDSRLTIAGESVYQTVRNQSVTYITGPPKCGRTTLGRSLFCDFLSDGYFPLLLEASDPGMRPGSTIPAAVVRRIRNEYGDTAVDAFIQLPREKRVVILDNADALRGRNEDIATFIEFLTNFAGYVVILGDDTLGAMTRIRPDAQFDVDQKSYEILPLNFSARERLAEKWFAHGDFDEFELSQQKENATRIFDTIIGRNYVPAFPIYVVAILKAAEQGTSVDSKASTHGYFYDLLIRQALTSGSANRDTSIYRGFLTHLAHDMHIVSRNALSDHELRASFETYDKKIMMAGLEFSSLISDLSQRGMLTQEGGETKFRYPYLYNYFVANYIAEHVGEAEVKSEIDNLTQHISEQQAADILIFLAHLSHDPYMLEALRTRADQLFSSYEIETLDTITQGGEDDVPLEYEEKSQDDARREVAANKDRQTLKASDSTGDAAGTGSLQTDVVSALHTIRVMGQILKNFPSLDADAKADLMRSSYTLGLRLLNRGLSSLNIEREDFVERTIVAVRSVFPGVAEEKLRAQADRYLSILRLIMTYGVLKVVVTSLATPDLERIYGLVFGETISSAETIIRVVLEIETKTTYPSAEIVRTYDTLRSPLAKLIVRVFVIDSFNRLYVLPAEKQRVCSNLRIRYKVLGIKKAERAAIPAKARAIR